jgi:excisionase family DNA binding protein
MDDYLTLKEAADLLGVSRWTIWRRVRAGELQAHKAGVDRRTRLVKRADVEALMHPHAIVEDREGQAAALRSPRRPSAVDGSSIGRT